MDFLLCFVRGEIVPCRFCGGPDSDGHLFWSILISPSFTFVIVLSFVIFWLMDRSFWPRCLLWHGWLLALACSCGASLWAASDDYIADARLERILGSYRFLADLAACCG